MLSIRINSKAILILLTLFILISLYISYYVFLLYVQIFCVNLGKIGELIWCSGGPGTFFPFPRESGYEAVISPSYSLIDYVIYVLFISTSLIYLLLMVSWAITLLLAWYFVVKVSSNGLRNKERKIVQLSHGND